MVEVREQKGGGDLFHFEWGFPQALLSVMDHFKGIVKDSDTSVAVVLFQLT
jgi:hypothetical protein